jgi:hypothetical protein
MKKMVDEIFILAEGLKKLWAELGALYEEEEEDAVFSNLLLKILDLIETKTEKVIALCL